MNYNHWLYKRWRRLRLLGIVSGCALAVNLVGLFVCAGTGIDVSAPITVVSIMGPGVIAAIARDKALSYKLWWEESNENNAESVKDPEIPKELGLE